MTEAVQIQFQQGNQILLNILLAFIMFGVALELSVDDILNAFRKPKPTGVGLLSQFILMPAMTFVLVYLWKPEPGLALGLILVAACPGGNVSNFISSIARADVGLSVSLTAVSTLFCIFFTPFNFEFWAGILPEVQPLLRSVSMNVVQLFEAVLMLLFIPMILGMGLRRKFPEFALKIQGPIRKLSMLVFAVFIIGALWNNRAGFSQYLDKVFVLVLVHNLMALVLGYAIAKAFTLKEQQCRTISIETGIQNAGLGLILCLNFFPEIGEMALVCAWWGIWHIVSGMSFGYFWSKRKIES